MEEPSFGLILVVLAVLVIAGFAHDAYWGFIEWFARKFVREPLDRRAQRRQAERSSTRP
jgi:hypothetical protein